MIEVHFHMRGWTFCNIQLNKPNKPPPQRPRVFPGDGTMLPKKTKRAMRFVQRVKKLGHTQRNGQCLACRGGTCRGLSMSPSLAQVVKLVDTLV